MNRWISNGKITLKVSDDIEIRDGAGVTAKIRLCTVVAPFDPAEGCSVTLDVHTVDPEIRDKDLRGMIRIQPFWTKLKILFS